MYTTLYMMCVYPSIAPHPLCGGLMVVYTLALLSPVYMYTPVHYINMLYIYICIRVHTYVFITSTPYTCYIYIYT